MSDLRFPMVGGAVAVDFVNTCPTRRGTSAELLSSYADLIDWATAFGVLSRPLEPADPRGGAALAKAHALRAALRSGFEAITSGDDVPELTIASINDALSARSGPLQLHAAQGGWQLSHCMAIDTPGELVAAIATSAAELFAGTEGERLRSCRGPECVLWFVDRTRNGSRAWCRMDRCGAQAKASAYYLRQKQKAGSQAD